MYSQKSNIRKADLLYMLESFISGKLTRIDDRVTTYSLNNYATLVAKLNNIKIAMGYDFDFVIECVENVGLSKAITQLDNMSQMLMKSKRKPSGKKTRKHEKTQPLIESTDIGIGSDLDDE